jgi:hypothetical protein
MRIKLIVPLLALCFLALSVASVQAQTDVIGDMKDVNLVMTGNVTEKAMCNLIGGAVMVDVMDNATSMANITGSTTLNVTGKGFLIQNLGNMTEKAVIVGKMENMPGVVIIFGQRGNIIANLGNMDMGTNGVARNLVVIRSGNMTGEIMLSEAGMNNTTGKMTANITGDITRKAIIAKNVGDISANTVQNICSALSASGNMTLNESNMSEPMKCNLIAKAIIIRNMDNMTMDESGMDYPLMMDENEAALGRVDNTTGMNNDMNESMNGVTIKAATIRNLDDAIGIMTTSITCNTSRNLFLIKTTGNVTENMTETPTEEMTGNMTETPTEEMTGNMTETPTEEMTGNMTENTTEM